MRFSDLLYFLRQIFFPNWKTKEIDEDDEPNRLVVGMRTLGKKFRSKESVGTVVSVLFHLLILFLLSLFLLPVPLRDGLGTILGGFNELPAELAKKDDAAEAEVKLEPDKPTSKDSAPQANEEKPKKTETEEVKPTPASSGQTIDAPPIEGPGETEAAPASQGPRKTTGFVDGGGFGGRTSENRARGGGLGQGDGGAGENAVEAGLAWLAAHQNKSDGSWSFDFQNSCKQCNNSGDHGSRIAATSLALLPFLGAGYTHDKPSRYRTVVEDGLAFLLHCRKFRESDNTIDYIEGLNGMYAHGLAAIVLCEAHAMSGKKLRSLRDGAQGAIDFIEKAQDQRTGGWRYKPNQSPGDLSVSGWQIMALKSAKLASLHVPQGSIYLASDFLDAVAMDGGRQYNYLPEREKFSGSGDDSQRTCSATGLLLRMYLGWEPGEKMLDEGIDLIEQSGPLRPNGTECCLYYAYYATLAMHHYGGSGWKRWSTELSDFLVRHQAKQRHEAGSWFFPDRHADTGGRLLNTSLAILILETPYRILPLYRKP